MNSPALKRPVGRPRTGKIKLILFVDPEIKNLIDINARQRGLRRSAYIESIILTLAKR